MTPSSNGQDHLEIDAMDDEFADRLEWAVRTGARRQARFAAGGRRRGRLTTVIALVAVASLSLGATGALLVTQQVRGQHRLALLRAEMAVRLASESEAYLATQRAALESHVHAGLVSEDELEEWDLRRIEAQTNTRLRESELREVEARGTAPIDDISADAPGGHDFVRERLEILAQAVSARMDVRARRFEHLELLAATGRVAQGTVDEARERLMTDEREIERLATLIDLRAKLAAGEITPEQAEYEGLRASRRGELEALMIAEEAAVRRLDHTRKLAERAFETQRALLEREHELRMISLRRSGIEAELAVIEGMLEGKE